jgi:hypothetical protein
LTQREHDLCLWWPVMIPFQGTRPCANRCFWLCTPPAIRTRFRNTLAVRVQTTPTLSPLAVSPDTPSWSGCPVAVTVQGHRSPEIKSQVRPVRQRRNATLSADNTTEFKPVPPGTTAPRGTLAETRKAPSRQGQVARIRRRLPVRMPFARGNPSTKTWGGIGNPFNPLRPDSLWVREDPHVHRPYASRHPFNSWIR